MKLLSLAHLSSPRGLSAVAKPEKLGWLAKWLVKNNKTTSDAKEAENQSCQSDRKK